MVAATTAAAAPALLSFRPPLKAASSATAALLQRYRSRLLVRRSALVLQLRLATWWSQLLFRRGIQSESNRVVIGGLALALSIVEEQFDAYEALDCYSVPVLLVILL